jgi:uncharacterized NAD(P)/FAD-binding protein YdhS
LTLRIAIIGAGFSGTATAIQLLRRARGPLALALIEREPRRFAHGVAYSTFDPRHILNVPAGRMSLDPAAPDDFLAWLKGRGLAPRDDAAGWFAPRQLYGQYLEQRLREAEDAAPQAKLRRITGEALDLIPEAGALQLELRGGDRLGFDAAVLALGNFPPPHPVVADPQGYDSPRYFNRAWEAGAVEGIAHDDALLLIGTGLSSIDMLISLERNDHAGPIIAVSRRGLWPLPHTPAPAWPDFLPTPAPTRLCAVLDLVRAEIAKAAAAGVPWASVINALRPRTAALWRALPRAEQRRFLRHLRPWWEVARHRMPQSSADCIARLSARGQLETLCGRLKSIAEFESPEGGGLELGIRVKGPRGDRSERKLRVARVINCTGAESNYRKLADPLVRNLMRRGLAHADPLHLGLATSADGALLDAHDAAPLPLWTLGPCRKGSLWETTAVPEIRDQAAALAQRVLEHLAAS